MVVGFQNLCNWSISVLPKEKDFKETNWFWFSKNYRFVRTKGLEDLKSSSVF
jgi:hypothetical protein